MTVYNIALIGFGGVNRALAELVASRNPLWERNLGFRLNIVAVSDLWLGSVISPNGLDPKVLVDANFAKGGFGHLSGGSAEADNETIVKTAPAEDVSCKGISNLSPADIEAATRANSRWKLIGSAARNADGSVTGSVAPKQLALEHPLAAVNGASNAVSFKTELLGAVTVSGPGAGRIETAYALLSDIVAIHNARAAAVTEEAA